MATLIIPMFRVGVAEFDLAETIENLCPIPAETEPVKPLTLFVDPEWVDWLYRD